ncbi:hypothetical protein N8T08_008261 [Aspergillus melleus]|uniref:Uncharacterized protein n=1 Tax=Aspergillus melleus TaxID=138277 RepID=A0ACC3AWM2_9EURO|nr:hypothetical protein N8T08_008261 [Aspergillus melleus]
MSTVQALIQTDRLRLDEEDTGIPLVRDTGKSRFSLSTFIAYFFNANTVLREAYDTHLKRGRTCRIPDKSFGTMVILPNCFMRWMLSQPQNVLGSREAIVETVQARWTVGHSRYFTEEWHTAFLKRSIRALMDTEVPRFQEELERSISSVFGRDDKNWKEVNLATSIKHILVRSTSRYIVGSPLCSDPGFVRWTLVFMEVITPIIEVLRPIPQIFHQIIGRILLVPRIIVLRKLKNLLRPTYEERLRGLRNGDRSEGEPQDFLQKIMRHLYESNSPDLNLHFVTIHIMIFMLAAAVQPYMLTPHVIFDMLDSDAEFGTISQIQEELNDVYGEARKEEPRWTRNDASRLIKLDSVLRESLRINTLVSHSMPRKVMVDGLKTPDGYTLPKGSTVSLLARTVQTDPDIYPEPERHYEVELPVEYGGKRPPAIWITDLKIPPQNGRIRLKKKALY